MKSINRIMVVIDANEEYAASADGLPIEVRKALRLISDKDATSIKLVSVGYERYLSSDFRSIGYDYTKLRQEYIDRLTQSMEKLVTRLGQEGYEISCDVGWAHPRYELIVKMAQEFKADLLIQHCRAYGVVKHLYLTHDSWELVRHCPIPLLLVKDEDWPVNPMLMAAVDPVHSHHKPLQLDAQIITAAKTLADITGGDCHIVHAYAESARPFAPVGKVKEEHEAAFNELMSEHAIDKAHQHFIDESPVDALQHYGDKIDSDLVVMGAISRSRIHEALVGSTAENVLDYLKTDILVIKPTETS